MVFCVFVFCFTFKDKLAIKKGANVLVLEAMERVFNNKNMYQLWDFLMCQAHLILHIPYTLLHCIIPISQMRKLRHSLKLLVKTMQIDNK